MTKFKQGDIVTIKKTGERAVIIIVHEDGRYTIQLSDDGCVPYTEEELEKE